LRAKKGVPELGRESGKNSNRAKNRNFRSKESQNPTELILWGS
jgi:hypothetical protein